MIMYTLIIFLCSLGFFMLYNTSKRAKLSVAGKAEQWLQANPVQAKRAGVLLLVMSIVLLVLKDGLGVGLFTAFVLLMATASYMVAIAPFYYLRLKHIGALVFLSLLMELFIF